MFLNREMGKRSTVCTNNTRQGVTHLYEVASLGPPGVTGGAPERLLRPTQRYSTALIIAHMGAGGMPGTQISPISACLIEVAT